MLIPIKKAAEGFKTTTATASNYATDFIATGASKTSAGRAFHACPGQRTDRLEYRAVGQRDTIHIGAQNTTKQAGNLPDSEVFSRSKFMVLDVGIVYPQGRRHNLFCVLNPHIHPECLKSARDGFSVQQGTEPMTNVIPMARARAAELTQSHTSSLDIPQQQAAIENALAMAAYYMRQPRTPETLHAAIGKTSRAMTLLKNACADSLAEIGGVK